MRNDLIEVCRALQAQEVRYILVGGHAVRLNGIVRATEDVDILVPFDVTNGQRLIDGLLKAKTDYREEDVLDKAMPPRLKADRRG